LRVFLWIHCAPNGSRFCGVRHMRCRSAPTTSAAKGRLNFPCRSS